MLGLPPNVEDRMSQGTSVFQSAYSTLSRPTTAAVVKMLHKLKPFYSRKRNKPSSASDVQKIIERVNKYQKKASVTHAELVKSLGEWSTEIANDDTAAVVREFAFLLDAVDLLFSTRAESFNKLKIHMGAIASRETRQQLLVAKHAGLQKLKDGVAFKLGPNASKTLLVVDDIEENEYNLKLIEQQLLRTTSVNMREAGLDYLKWLVECLGQLGKHTRQLSEELNKTDPTFMARRIDRPSAYMTGGLRIPLSSFQTPTESSPGYGIDDRRPYDTERTSGDKVERRVYDEDRPIIPREGVRNKLPERAPKSQKLVFNHYESYYENQAGW